MAYCGVYSNLEARGPDHHVKYLRSNASVSNRARSRPNVVYTIDIGAKTTMNS